MQLDVVLKCYPPRIVTKVGRKYFYYEQYGHPIKISLEDLIVTGCFIVLSWPVMFIVLIVWEGLALICNVLDYLWRVEL